MGKYIITLLYDYFWVSIPFIGNYGHTVSVIQKSPRWVKSYSFYSQKGYIKTQTDEMSCPVLLIIWVARNSLKPVVEIKKGICASWWAGFANRPERRDFNRDFSNMVRRRGKAAGNSSFVDGLSLQSNLENVARCCSEILLKDFSELADFCTGNVSYSRRTRQALMHYWTWHDT